MSIAWMAAAVRDTADEATAVILISLDGTPSHAAPSAPLAGLARRGAWAERLIPVFPTNTFPNHVTLATGVAPATHGIVNNVFEDPERGRFAKSDDPSWIQAEPIWSIADRHGVVSASFYWVGSEGPWRSGHGPRYWKPFSSATPEAEKVEQILAWLDLPARQRPRLVTAWFRGVDAAGHRYGPDSEAARAALREQGPVLERLLAGLEARGRLATTTLLVVSDHGMAAVERREDLAARLRAAGVPARVLGAGGFSILRVEGGAEQERRAVAVARAAGLEAYLRAEAPRQLAVANPRFGEVVVIAPPGTSIESSGGPRPPMRGSHGYPPEMAEMGALLLAVGRGARPGSELGEVRALDIAPTVLALLGIEAPDWMEGRVVQALLPEAAAVDGTAAEVSR